MSKVRAIASTVSAVIAFGGVLAATPAQAVSGGAAAVDGAYGFVAKIEIDGSACSGALVASEWIVTSATCFPGNPQGGVPVKAATAIVGRTDLFGTTGKVAKVVNLVSHPSRGVMLARLDTTITGIAPVTLGGAVAAAGEKLRLAGYGRTTTEWVPNKLHSALFTVGTPTADNLPLVGDNGADACKGDAGGPVFRETAGKFELAGVVGASWQHGCLAVSETQQGTTATRTDGLAEWIRQQTFVATAKAVDHAITVSWAPVLGQGQLTYRVYAGEEPSVPVAEARRIGSTTGTSFTHKSLPAKKTLYYRVVTTPAGGTDLSSNVSSATTPVPAVSDFSGDGKDDIAVFTRGDTADVYAAVSDGAKFVGNSVKWHDRFATNNEVPLAGDFDGDGKTDIATFTRGTLGDVYVALSDGGKFVGDSQQWHGDFAFGEEIPAVGDFDGDGKDDIAVFTRGSTASVYVALSDGKKFVGNGVKWHGRFAGGAEVPVVGDFDGDGKDDIATFTRGTAGDVFVAFSDGGKFVGDSLQWHGDFAFGDEIPASGDFDGDGKDDIAVFTRGTAADVYVALSNGARFVGNGVKWHENFAFGAELPAVGDFTGDGKADIVTYTRGTGADVYVGSSDGSKFVGASVLWHGDFGFGDEVLVPRAFALGF
ncbi:FG-GAP-like repeat-containing protein [Amycolatopsis speibonae]|uniref:FG-GAP-like repeat-containing protein n=1 Tax=Amycolatopsis speibonae TaxID=1450224 RepID=A0ABV7P717_9PSEU